MINKILTGFLLIIGSVSYSQAYPRWINESTEYSITGNNLIDLSFGDFEPYVMHVCASLVKEKLQVSYDLHASFFCDISLYVSFDKGKNWVWLLENVHGDVGVNVMPGKKIIIWDYLEETRINIDQSSIIFKIISCPSETQIIADSSMFCEILINRLRIHESGDKEKIEGLQREERRLDRQYYCQGCDEARKKLLDLVKPCVEEAEKSRVGRESLRD